MSGAHSIKFDMDEVNRLLVQEVGLWVDLRRLMFERAAQRWPGQALSIWFDEANQSWRVGPSPP